MPEVIHDALRLLARRDVTTVSALLVRACRELLAREGLWPPAGGPRQPPA
jgi:hypothetical protein